MFWNSVSFFLKHLEHIGIIRTYFLSVRQGGACWVFSARGTENIQFCYRVSVPRLTLCKDLLPLKALRCFKLPWVLRFHIQGFFAVLSNKKSMITNTLWFRPLKNSCRSLAPSNKNVFIVYFYNLFYFVSGNMITLSLMFENIWNQQI